MEDILTLYAEPYDPARPVVCFDECPYALQAAVRDPLPAAPGRVRREDSEYERHGSCSLLGVFEPATGWRELTASPRRRRREVAEQWRVLVEEQFPEAEVIRVVLDNLNTHTPAALYEVFAPEHAAQLASKLELHFTPTHGSWLNMIEIEWSILARQVLRQRLGSLEELQDRSDAWAAERNQRQAMIDWRFTVEDARETMHKFYQAVREDPS
jgi:hypothetical protein